ncbi:hypothetical protein R1sor_020996 [Riccia sorocarpa]|uniref:Uncharacterized protein n=1 Tax=Riccia sorocarpa TaxID=122646 RepID=A0ABD3GJ49_9MARC
MTIASQTIEPNDEDRFDPPKVDAFSQRARRRIHSIQEADNTNQNDVMDQEDEDDPPKYPDVVEEADITHEKELADQEVLAEFLNTRFQAIPDTGREHILSWMRLRVLHYSRVLEYLS